MKIESKGYQITGLPYDGAIDIVPDSSVKEGVRIDVTLRNDDGCAHYTRSDLIVLRGAIEHAERIAEQMMENQA